MKPAVITLWPHQISYHPLLKSFDPRWLKCDQIVLDTSLVRQASPIGLAFTIGSLISFLSSSTPRIKMRAQRSILEELNRIGFLNALSSQFDVTIEESLFDGIEALPLIASPQPDELTPPILELRFGSGSSITRRDTIDTHLPAARSLLLQKFNLAPKRIGNFLYILQELMKNTADHSEKDALLALEASRSGTHTTLNFAYIEFGPGIKKNVERYLDQKTADSLPDSRAGNRHISEIYRLAFQCGFTTKKTQHNLGKGLHRIASYIRSMEIDMHVFDGSSIGNISIIGPNPSHKQTRLAFSATSSNCAPFSYTGSWQTPL